MSYSTEELWKMVHAVDDEGDELELSEWEIGFISRLIEEEQDIDMFTPNQAEKIVEIHNKVV